MSNLARTGRQRWDRCDGDRLPFAPFEAVVRLSAATLAKLLDVDTRQIYRWRSYGLTWVQADELAVSVGRHPSEVWGLSW